MISMRVRGRRLRCVWAVLLAVALWGGACGAPGTRGAPPDSVLTVRVFDVGQADAILVSMPEGRHLLVDGGRDSRVVEQLLEVGVDSLDLVIASHMHADHLGGLDAVVQALDVALAMDNGGDARTAVSRDFRGATTLARVAHMPARDTSFTFGSARVEVLTSPLQAHANNENDRSLIVRVAFGEFSVLLPGDAERDELQALVARGLRPVTVLKAAHHGALNGVSPGWLQALAPKAVVISVGRNNTYGHPDPMALRYYETGDRRVYRTDRDGTVTIRGKRDGTFTVSVSTPP